MIQSAETVRLGASAALGGELAPAWFDAITDTFDEAQDEASQYRVARNTAEAEAKAQ